MTDITTTGKPPLLSSASASSPAEGNQGRTAIRRLGRLFVRAVKTSAQLNPDLQAVTWQSLWDACLRACRAGSFARWARGGHRALQNPGAIHSDGSGCAAQCPALRPNQMDQSRRGAGGRGIDHAITHTGEVFRHVPGDNFSAPIIKAYALAITKDDAFYSAVMSKAEVDKHRAFSRASRRIAHEINGTRRWPSRPQFTSSGNICPRCVTPSRMTTPSSRRCMAPIRPSAILNRPTCASSVPAVDDTPGGCPRGTARRGGLLPSSPPAADPDDGQISIFETNKEGAKR